MLPKAGHEAVTTSSLDFTTSLTFTARNPLYTTEKPYAFVVPLENSAIPSTNIDYSASLTVRVTDIRGRKDEFTLEKDGFQVFEIERDRELEYQEYFDEEGVKGYFDIVEGMLRGALGARDVKVFRHAIPRRHPTWPDKYNGEVLEFDQPSTVAHIDCTPREIYQELRRHHSTDFERLSQSRIQWINIWKPLHGPLSDYPLLLCSSSSVSASDVEPADVLYADHVAENTCIYPKERYKWYYLSGQTTSEMLVFVQGDTAVGAVPGVPHCSARNPHTPKDERPRESIEARCLVFYD